MYKQALKDRTLVWYVWVYICISCKIALGYISMYLYISMQHMGLPWWLSSKESTCNAGDMGLIPGSERAPGEENGYSLQYSCLGNPMDREAWRATVHGVSRVRHNLVTKPLPLELKPFFQVTFSIHDYRISTSNSSLKFHTKLNVLVKKIRLQ